MVFYNPEGHDIRPRRQNTLSSPYPPILFRYLHSCRWQWQRLYTPSLQTFPISNPLGRRPWLGATRDWTRWGAARESPSRPSEWRSERGTIPWTYAESWTGCGRPVVVGAESIETTPLRPCSATPTPASPPSTWLITVSALFLKKIFFLFAWKIFIGQLQTISDGSCKKIHSISLTKPRGLFFVTSWIFVFLFFFSGSCSICLKRVFPALLPIDK